MKKAKVKLPATLGTLAREPTASMSETSKPQNSQQDSTDLAVANILEALRKKAELRQLPSANENAAAVHAVEQKSASKISNESSEESPRAKPNRSDTPDFDSELAFDLGEQANPHAMSLLSATIDTSFQQPDPKAAAKARIPTYRPSVRPPMAVLRLFNDGELTYISYPMMTPRFQIGRREGDLVVAHDLWMSGRHAEIQRRQIGNTVRWYLLDANSTNGSFIKTDFVLLKNRDELFIGRERYRFQFQPPEASLLHVTRKEGELWHFSRPIETIGSDVPNKLSCINNDPFLDPIHATFTKNPDGTWIVRDNQSKNGIWFRVREIELQPDSQFQLGEQRFGFWFQR